MAINWAVGYVAPAFGLQSLLLTIVAAGGLAFDRKYIAARFAAIGLVVCVPS